ncbi:reverse transcriptase domain-containing protein [Priestia aryabhattai]|uniref:reverse transcriptase/maturase family protein n=1 Tax=Priestia aryabhattai TaxID=412384 RepID=UPI003D2C995F
MRNPNVILDNLARKAKDKSYTFERLYRNLYNPMFYMAAYNKVYANPGNMTKGIDGCTIDGMSLKRIENVIGKLKDESYQPNPVRRTFIPKKRGGRRPLGIPSFDDKLVQEVVRKILEAIFEQRFSKDSHGFRPQRSCHTALIQCKERFNGVRWFIEGDIKSFFDNIDHHILIGILRKTIKDEKLIRLIWKFLKAGYVENWTYHRTYSGTPQGGIISPILANIYLNELDQYVEKYKNQFEKGTKRRTTKAYVKYQKRARRFKDKYKPIWHQLSEEEKSPLIKQYKKLESDMYKYPYFDPMDESFKRLQYVRYADDFIIGVIGSKEDATRVKKDLTAFISQNLNLDLSQEKTLITHSYKKARFLGYDIVVSRTQQLKKRKDGAKMRGNSYKCHLYVPREAWVEKLKELRAIRFSRDNKWKPIHRTYLISHDDLEVLSIYNAEIRGLYEYYKLANNVSTLHHFLYFMKYSMFKTYARKYRKSVKQIIAKYNINGKFGIKYRTKNGQKIRLFYDDGFHKLKTKENLNFFNDNQPPKFYFDARNSLIVKLMSFKCEYCGVENVPIEMHHVRKLKDLKGKKRWEQHMIARKRKTIPLCISCHDKLHAGKLD